MRFLIIFIFLTSNSFANEATDIKNLIINKELKKYDNLTFLDAKKRQVNINDYQGNLILLNFWQIIEKISTFLQHSSKVITGFRHAPNIWASEQVFLSSHC